MLKDLNELTPYERELLRDLVIRKEERKPEIRDAERELRIPAPPRYN